MILAGGRATRFGAAPKGLARLGDLRLVDRVADALAGCTDSLLLVAHAPDAHGWLPGLRVVADLHPGCGALGGLHAALAHAATDVLVVAWDMPFVTVGLLRALRDAGRDAVSQAAGAGAAAVPLHPDGHLEPLCAFYAAACAGVADRLLQRGERRAGALADAVHATRLTAPSLATFGDPRTLLLSVNTADDLAHAADLAGLPAAPA